jgi:hypothetical protein
MKLLSTGNPKILKGVKQGYMTYILHLAPADVSGYNTCPKATAGCKAACLNTAGRGGMFKKGEMTNVIQEARKRKTRMFFENRSEFMGQLVKDIRLAIKQCEKVGLIPVFRLNGTSDIAWEKYEVEGARNIFELFPDVQFYDYTKNYLRFDKVLPSNYHLTFSRSETNGDKAMELLSRGVNVAIVFDKLPETYGGFKVINADETDLRFLDAKGGVICGLKYKKMTGKGANNALAFESGFAIRTQPMKEKKVEKKLVEDLVD